MTDSDDRLLLLDTASLYYRAFFALPDTLTAPDGTVVNALRGLLDFVARLTTDHRPTVTVACWDDDWRPAWRVELLDSYKTHRLAAGSELAEETPEALSPQVGLIAEALELIGVAVVGAAGFEADDVIASYARSWTGPVDVVTGDRDLFQLIDDAQAVRVLYTSRGVANLDAADAAFLEAKYGVRPDQYVDLAVLRGDPSDGLPGVAGIGEKTAARLLAEHGDLAGIRAAAGDETSALTPRLRANLLAAEDYLDRAVPVVTARDDLDLPVPARKEPDWEAFAAFAERWGLGGVADRLRKAIT